VSRLVEYDSVKLKLRLPDDTLKEEILLYMQEVDDLVLNRLRNKLGSVDANGYEIELPLTLDTEPQIDEEVKAIASDLVIGKFRLQNSEKPLLWDTGIKNLDNYLDRRFGWTRDVLFKQVSLFQFNVYTATPGSQVDFTGQRWRPNSIITIENKSGNMKITTDPDPIIADKDGNIEGQITIDADEESNTQIEINVTDDQFNEKTGVGNGRVIPFTVT